MASTTHTLCWTENNGGQLGRAPRLLIIMLPIHLETVMTSNDMWLHALVLEPGLAGPVQMYIHPFSLHCAVCSCK